MRAQVERLEHDRTPAPAPSAAPVVQTVQPVKTIVRVYTQALTPAEIKSLLDEVEWGFARVRNDLRGLKVFLALMLFGSVPLYFTKVWILG